MAERIRGLVEGHAFQYEGRTYPVTVSVGVGCTDGGESLAPDELIRRADEKLFRAKHEGRNWVAS